MRSNAKQVMQKLQRRLDNIRREAPAVLANEGQKVFNEAMRMQSWDGKKWPEVQRRQSGTKAFRYARPKSLRTNPILVGKSRRLKNAVNRAVISHNIKRIKWGVRSVEYAAYHNDGKGQKQRTFMAVGIRLRRRLKDKFEQLYRKRL